MTVLEVLKKAKERINHPNKWCAYWCVSNDEKRLGADAAVWEVIADKKPKWLGNQAEHLLFDRAMEELAEFSGINSMWKPFDRVVYLTKHKDVMNMFDKAIDKIEKMNVAKDMIDKYKI